MTELAGGCQGVKLKSGGLSSHPPLLFWLLDPICDRFSGFITALIFPGSPSLGGGIKDVCKMEHINEVD